MLWSLSIPKTDKSPQGWKHPNGYCPELPLKSKTEWEKVHRNPPPQGGAPLVLCKTPINCFEMCMHRINMDKPIKHTEPIVLSWL